MASLANLTAFEDYPLQPPPSGQFSNFDSPETRGPAIVLLCSIFLGIMWPVFILRLYSNVWVIRRYWWDDGTRRNSLARLLLTYSIASAMLAAVCTLFLDIDQNSIPDIYQVGGTAYAAGLIWLIDKKIMGLHEWDVRAVLFTPDVKKVSLPGNRKFMPG